MVGEKARFQATFNEAPMALLDLASIDYRAQEAHGLWIDIYAPKDAAPGTYKGQITFSVEGKEAAQRPLTVKVYPFELDPRSQRNRGSVQCGIVAQDPWEYGPG